MSRSTVTITDIARRAGVSPTAVSSALHGTGRVSEEQRTIIQNIAREMNYQPSVAAQIMRSHATNGIALVITDDHETASESGVTAPLVAHFVRKCEAEGVRYHIDYAMESLSGSPVPPSMLGGLVSGGIVAERMPPQLREWFTTQERYPWVAIDDTAPYTVVSSVDDGIAEAVRHLAALRHRKIAFGGLSPTILVHAMIRDGFERTARAYDLHVAEGWNAHFEGATRVEQLNRYAEFAQWLLTQPDRPTAMVCADTKMARAVIYIAQRLGIRVPEDLSIVGYGTSGDAEKGIPCVAQVEPNFAGMIDKSITILQHLIDGKPVDQGVHRVPAKFTQRATVAWANTED
ncbi:MAG: LacI family DNA-binding transcriptional regulator [Capsulimonadaceae bacterium]|nr:LacI family DNA-binding transcriptional regulator [Capsulimonadaceae bacterium]